MLTALILISLALVVVSTRLIYVSKKRSDAETASAKNEARGNILASLVANVCRHLAENRPSAFLIDMSMPGVSSAMWDPGEEILLPLIESGFFRVQKREEISALLSLSRELRSNRMPTRLHEHLIGVYLEILVEEAEISHDFNEHMVCYGIALLLEHHTEKEAALEQILASASSVAHSYEEIDELIKLAREYHGTEELVRSLHIKMGRALMPTVPV